MRKRPPGGVLRHQARVAGMFADPECVGELLLVGVALARGLDLGDPAPIGDAYSLRDIGMALYGQQEDFAGRDLVLPVGPGWQERRSPDPRSTGGKSTVTLTARGPRHPKMRRGTGRSCSCSSATPTRTWCSPSASARP